MALIMNNKDTPRIIINNLKILNKMVIGKKLQRNTKGNINILPIITKSTTIMNINIKNHLNA